jgi:hypothetical protein
MHFAREQLARCTGSGDFSSIKYSSESQSCSRASEVSIGCGLRRLWRGMAVVYVIEANEKAKRAPYTQFGVERRERVGRTSEVASRFQLQFFAFRDRNCRCQQSTL